MIVQACVVARRLSGEVLQDLPAKLPVSALRPAGSVYVLWRSWPIYVSKGRRLASPGVRIDVVELNTHDQRRHEGSTISAAIRRRAMTPPESKASQRSFGRVVRETNPAIVEERREAVPALQ